MPVTTRSQKNAPILVVIPQSDDDSANEESDDSKTENEETSSGDESEPDDNSNDCTIAPPLRWRKNFLTKPLLQPSQQEGPGEEFAACSSPVDYFMTYLNEDIVNNIVYQSNLYATQEALNSGMQAGDPIDDNDLYVFLGINFHMGFHRLPSYKNYWSNCSDLGIECVKEVMTRNRFAEMNTMLHLADNALHYQHQADRLYKVRTLIQQMNYRFQHLYKPGQIQAIDEAMVLFKGRSALKQYNPMKPIKRGYKFWCRAETNGYINQFDVYQGKTVHVDADAPVNLGLGGKVVVNFSSSLQRNNHILFFDNYFSSVFLMKYLKDRGILACGTVRSNRQGLPVLTADKHMKRGDVDWRVSDDLLFLKWMDKRSVHLLSTAHGTEAGTAERKMKDGKKVKIDQPLLVADYNKNMGGVDKADMLRSLYGFDRKTYKWWHRIFFAIMDFTMVNSYIVYCDLAGHISLLDYVRRVSTGLMAFATKIPMLRNPRRASQEMVPSNRGIHWPQFTASRRRCAHCAKHGIESRPSLICSFCKVPLCCSFTKNCFAAYHNVQFD
jgi:hypothetical protein